MKKAFDSNVAKFKPRLRTGTMESPGDPEGATPAPDEGGPASAAAEAEAYAHEAEAVETRSVGAQSAAETAETDAGDASMIERRERLERVKRRVREAALPAPIVVPMPSAAAAGQSALVLLRELETQLARAREVEEAMRADLSQARGEQARSAADAKRAHEKLGVTERSLEEKRSVLADLLAEMGALEEERDDAVRRSQALSALDEERQQVLTEVSQELEDARGEVQAAETEMLRLSEELDARGSESARLRAALAEVTRERDTLARELGHVRAERDELHEARRALEQVHEALAQVRSKLA